MLTKTKAIITNTARLGLMARAHDSLKAYHTEVAMIIRQAQGADLSNDYAQLNRLQGRIDTLATVMLRTLDDQLAKL